MQELVVFNAEKRFSIKILGHKIKKFFPSYVYRMSLVARYLFFRNKCKDSLKSEASYSDGSWVNRKTTKDLKRIQEFLLEKHSLNVLQIGIGNSSLYSELSEADRLSSFLGVTVVPEELDYAKNLFPEKIGTDYSILLENKYSATFELPSLKFDFIVDNDISAYACCKFHFFKMLSKYKESLKEDGAILVGLQGLEYFDSGFGLTPNKMKSIALKQGFKFSKNNYCYLLRK